MDELIKENTGRIMLAYVRGNIVEVRIKEIVKTDNHHVIALEDPSLARPIIDWYDITDVEFIQWR